MIVLFFSSFFFSREVSLSIPDFLIDEWRLPERACHVTLIQRKQCEDCK
jgi:hypothetical protein